MKGFLIGLSKLIVGVAIALMLLSLAGVATARYFMGRLSILPPKPVFENDVPVQPATPPEAPAPGVAAATDPAAPEPASAAPEPDVEPSLYSAVVVQPIGLVIREGPGTSYSQLGGIDYNEKVEVLEEDSNQDWIRIRVLSSGQEGWVKAGNIRKTQ